MKEIHLIPFRKIPKYKFGLNLFNFYNLLPEKNIINISYDYLFLHKKSRILEKKLAKYLFKRLNKYHGLNFSYRQWYTILGYWLRRYSNVTTFRMYLIQKLIYDYKFEKLNFYLHHDSFICNKNSYSFIQSTDEPIWNDIFFEKIVSCFNRVSKKKISVNYQKKKKKYKLKNFFPYTGISKFKILIDKFLSKFINDTDYLIDINKLNYFEKIKLSLSLKQIFRPNIFPEEIDNNNNYLFRKKLISEIQCKKFDVYNVSKKLIFEYLPEIYLENFKNNLEIATRLNFPKKPKKIITDNGADTNELFKIWTALKIKNKTKLYLLQHGNNYGTALNNDNTPEEIISDKFFSWGWKNSRKIFKGFNYQVKSKNLKENDSSFYFYLNAKPNLDQPRNTIYSWNQSLEQNYQFISRIKNLDDFKIIPHPHYLKTTNLNDYGILLKFKNNFSFKNYNSVPKLSIFGYDSTGFYKNISVNLPSIILFQIKNSHLKKEVIKDYENLKLGKVLFEDPRLLVNFLQSHNFDIDKWWYHKTTQNVINKFKSKYSRFSKNKIEDLKKFILA